MRSISVLSVGAMALVTGFAYAGFGGQTILGPLGPGSSITGDNTFSNDDNDGFFSGTHIFNIWDGGDDAWALDWPGGDLTVDLIASAGDPDLFLYEPGSYDESAIYSTLPGNMTDTVSKLGAPAGRYYLVVDTTFFSEGPYTINVHPVPAPAGLGLLALAGLAGARRRR